MMRAKVTECLDEAAILYLMPRIFGGALLGKTMKGRGKGLDFEEKFMHQREYDAQNQKYLAARSKLNRRMEIEKSNSQMNRLKIQNQWRKLMRLTKVESLRKEIEILSQNHERDVDRKDATIQMLDRDVEEAGDQFHAALRSHLQNIDHLVDLQDSRLQTSEVEFDHELHALETAFKAEKNVIVAHHFSETRDLDNIMAAIDSEERDHETETSLEYEQMREEIRNKNLEEINMLRIGLDSQIEDLEQHFETAHLNYLQTTDQQTRDFKYFTKKDQELSREIEIKIRKTERLQASLHHWRTKLVQNVRECAQRNQLLSDERSHIQGHFQQLKARMNRFRQAQGSRLAELVLDARLCKNKLSCQLALAERIILLAEFARKMETDQEKVVPFEVISTNSYAATAAKTAPGGPHQEARQIKSITNVIESTMVLQAETTLGEPANAWSQLDNFLQKYNKVLIDKLAIERERAHLEKENLNLQGILKQYFDGVSVNDDIMHSSNPLFVVNGNFHSNAASLERNLSHLTAIDAIHMVATSRADTPIF